MRICPFCGDNVVGNHTDCRMNQPTAEQRIAALERELAEAREAVRDLPLCGEHQQYGKSHDGECFGCDLAALREQNCETCQHNDCGDCALTLHVEVSDLGSRFDSWTPCERLGNGCRAWARREP